MAKKFAFKLDPVLRYRNMIEQNKMKEFAAANRAAEEVRMEQRQIEADRQATQAGIGDLYEGNVPFSEIMEHYRYINILNMNLTMGARKLQQLEKVAEEKRAVYMEARRERRVLEILRERREEEHKKDLEREVQNDLDELGIQAKRRRDEEAARREL